jgi:hypothetical protein
MKSQTRINANVDICTLYYFVRITTNVAAFTAEGFLFIESNKYVTLRTYYIKVCFVTLKLKY